jgi:hypothetical protein
MTFFDERFLTHRLRSSTAMGIVGGTLAVLLWFYHYVFEHRFSWDLFAVAVTMAIVKQGMMLWYRLTD